MAEYIKREMPDMNGHYPLAVVKQYQHQDKDYVLLQKQ